MVELCKLLVEHLQLMGLGIISLVISSLIAWKFGYFHIPHREGDRTKSVLFRDVLGAFAVFLIIEVVIIPYLSVAWFYYKEGHLLKAGHPPIDRTTQGWFNILAILCAAVGIGLYYFSLSKRLKAVLWGMRGFSHAIGDFVVGALSWLISYPFIVVISQFIAVYMMLEYPAPHAEQLAVKQLKTTFSNPVLFWMTTFAVIFVVPVVEELIFRGFLQTWLVSRLGKIKGIAIAAFIFAAFHFSTTQGTDNVELLASLFTLGCFLGYVYERQRSLFAPIGLHMTFNAISILFIAG